MDNLLKENVNTLKTEIMSLYDINNINHINIDIEHYSIEITLPTNNDIVDDFMEMGKTITIDLQSLIFTETVTKFNIINNKIENVKRILDENNSNGKDAELIILVTKFITSIDFETEIFEEQEYEFISSDFDNVLSHKREHKSEEKEREKSRKAGLLRKEFLTGTGKFSEKNDKKDDKY